jgi:hypothetical protein
MKPTIRVQSILDRFPEAEHIFSMYEIDINTESSQMSIENICDHFDVDLEDILLDLEEFVEDTRQAKWLANGGEEWTEGFTEEEETFSAPSGADEENIVEETEEGSGSGLDN